MTVYVDDMYKYPMGQFRRMKMSHMIADTEEELHEMARKIGVARKWYQGDHYDICLSKRAKAVAQGAQEVTQKQLGCMVGKRRRTGELGSPASAEVWFKRLVRIRRIKLEIRRLRETGASNETEIDTSRGCG